jgi:hydroxypyruvate reductase
MTPNDRWVLLLSGGASALVLSPKEGIAPQRLQALTDAFLSQEIPIGQINTVRQHCSTFKGGGWLSMTPCDGLTLAISDVEQDSPVIVGSGPSVVPDTTARNAIRILQKCNLDTDFSDIVAILQKETSLPATSSSSLWLSLADNQSWLDALQQRLQHSGYDSDVFPEGLSQPMSDVISTVSERVREAVSRGDTGWLLFGGEPVCQLPEASSRGVGGRMQHLAMALAWEWRRESWPYTLLAAASDGSDGPTSASGALLCHKRVEGCDEKEWSEALKRWDSTTWHHQRKSLWETGATGTNVRDVLLIDLSVQ